MEQHTKDAIIFTIAIVTIAIVTVAWLYAAARMISYGWNRGKWRAEQDNKREETESKQQP